MVKLKICKYMHTYTSICAHLCLYLLTTVPVSVHTCTYFCAHMYLYLFRLVPISMYTCPCICTHLYLYVCTPVPVKECSPCVGPATYLEGWLEGGQVVLTVQPGEGGGAPIKMDGNKTAAQAAGADPSRCNSTNRPNPPLQ